MEGRLQAFPLLNTVGNHYGLVLQTSREKEEDVFFVDDEESDEEVPGVSYKSVKKVHEVNNHERKEQLHHAYTNAGLMSPETAKMITRVVSDCRVCQKFDYNFCFWNEVSISYSS